MFKNKKAIKSIVLGLALVMLLGVGAVAANQITEKQITAVYGGINLNFEGKNVTQEVENKYGTPVFLVDDRTYIPVRALAEVLGLSVDYRFEERTAYITDPKTSELIAKDKKIEELEKEIKALEKKLEKLENKVEEEENTDIKQVEKEVNRDYGTYRSLDFDIQLSEKSNYIYVDIIGDFKTTNDKMYWENLTLSNKRDLLNGVSEIIEKTYRNTEIKGRVYDNYDKKTYLEFAKKPKQEVAITNYGSDSVDDLSSTSQRYIEKEFDYYDIRDARVDRYDITRTSTYADISFTSRYEKSWKSLKNSEITTLLDKVADELIYASGSRDLDTDIGIYIDNDLVGTYYRKYNDRYGTYKAR